MVAPEQHYYCPRCLVGRLRPVRANFLMMYAGQLLSVPNLTVHTCDVCGLREYDDRELGWLEHLELSPAPDSGEANTGSEIGLDDLPRPRRFKL